VFLHEPRTAVEQAILGHQVNRGDHHGFLGIEPELPHQMAF
jgi:hypothetical protein